MFFVYRRCASASIFFPHFCDAPRASFPQLLRCARRLMSAAAAVRRSPHVRSCCGAPYMCVHASVCAGAVRVCMYIYVCMRVCAGAVHVRVSVHASVCADCVHVRVSSVLASVCTGANIFFFSFFFFVYTGAVQTQVYSFLISVARRVPHF